MKKKKETIEDILYRTYQEGLRCACRHGMAAECPYRFGTTEGKSWLEGYQDGIGTE